MGYERIVSLTPSITETVFALGAGERLVGVTDSCDYPPEANSKPHICSWFAPDIKRIAALKPDLILGLETAHQGLAPLLEARGARDIRLVLFSPATVEDALSDIMSLGAFLNMRKAAELLVGKLQRRLEKLNDQVKQIPREEQLTVSRVLDIEDNNLIVAGPGSFQYDVIRLAGGINVTTATRGAYPKVSFQAFRSWDPDMIFFCGTDQKYITRLQADPLWQSLEAIRRGNIHLFDCGLTCRTGPRIVDMAELLFKVLYG